MDPFSAFLVQAAISVSLALASMALAGRAKIKSPRLSDLGVQSQAYGVFIPIVYGRVKLSGNIVWFEGNQLDAVKHKKKSGGFLGMGGASYTWYTYDATMVVALCEGTVASIQRVWADSTLIHTQVTAPDSGFSILSSYHSSEISKNISLFTGSATQSAYEHTSNEHSASPAFRNVAYLGFKDLQLEKYGNRIPTIGVELTTSSAVTDWNQVATFADADNWSAFEVRNGVVYLRESAANEPYWRKMLLTGEPAQRRLMGGSSYSVPVTNNPGLYYTSDGGSGPNALTDGDRNIAFVLADDFKNKNGGWLNPAALTMVGDFLCGIVDYGSTQQVHLWPVSLFSDGFPVRSSAHYANISRLWYDEIGEALYAATDTTLYSLSPDNLTLINTWTIDITYQFSILEGRMVSGKIFGGGTDMDIRVEDLNTDGTTTLIMGKRLDFRGALYWVSKDLVLTNDGIYQVNSTGNSAITLASVVSDICLRAGLSAGDIDVTALTDAVDGYVISSLGDLQAALEPLQTAYQFDVVESEYKLKFVPRGAASVASLTADDLTAHEPGQERGVPLSIERKEESELPVSVDIKYFDQARDYDQGAQSARRTTTTAGSVLEIELPLVLSDTKAAQVAEMMLYGAWEERVSYEFSLPYKWSKLEPADIVTLVYEGTTHRIRLTEINAGKPGVLQCKGVADRAEIYSTVAVPAQSSAVISGGVYPGPAKPFLLDIPILTSGDDDAGFYIAAGGYYSDFSGAVAFRSTDEGASYTEVKTVDSPTTWGFTTAALADAGNKVIDYTNTLNVDFVFSVPATVTEAQMLDGANFAAVGAPGRWEVIKFQTATLEGDGTYTLSGLVRGYRGTEHNTGAHAAGDFLVMLDNIERVSFGSSDIDQEQYYRLVSFGMNANESDSETFTNTGVGLLPYAPVEINGSRDGSLNLTINWTRRSRVIGYMRDVFDVDLGESTESYEVDIMSAASPSTVLRTITATSETASYTAAQQATDFGSPLPASVTVNIYQLSATVGRGYAGTATI